jgi:hypothetical protein
MRSATYSVTRANEHALNSSALDLPRRRSSKRYVLISTKPPSCYVTSGIAPRLSWARSTLARGGCISRLRPQRTEVERRACRGPELSRGCDRWPRCLTGSQLAAHRISFRLERLTLWLVSLTRACATRRFGLLETRTLTPTAGSEPIPAGTPVTGRWTLTWVIGTIRLPADRRRSLWLGLSLS